METPASAAAFGITPSTDSVFQSVEDSLDDVFYDEAMPTSAVVTAVNELPALRLRHNPGFASDAGMSGLYGESSHSSQISHPLSAAYYEMPSLTSDRYDVSRSVSQSFDL